MMIVGSVSFILQLLCILFISINFVIVLVFQFLVK